MQKKCSKCKQIKDLSLFTKHKRHADGHSSECKECKNSARRTDEYREKERIRAKEYYYKNIDKKKLEASKFRKSEKGKRYIKDEYLRRLYNITIDEYNSLFEKQNGRCAICGTHQSELTRKLAVDHSHKDGTIRGLLCSKCNTALGLVNENLDIIYSMIDYINDKEKT